MNEINEIDSNTTTNSGTPSDSSLEHLLPDSRISWQAIVIGFLIAIAFQILFGFLGLAIGFSIINPLDPLFGLGTWSFATTVYFIIAQVASLFIGSYAATRVSSYFFEDSSYLYGASIWALTTLITLYVGATGIGSTVKGIGHAAASVGSTVGSATQSINPPDLVKNFDIDKLYTIELPDEIKRTLRDNGMTADQIEASSKQVFNDVISEQERDRTIDVIKTAINNIARSPADTDKFVEKAIDELFGKYGIYSRHDIRQLENSLQERLNLSDREVDRIIDNLEQKAEATREEVEETFNNFTDKAVDIAEDFADTIGKIAFGLFFASLFGLFASIWGAKCGEEHIITE